MTVRPLLAATAALLAAGTASAAPPKAPAPAKSVDLARFYTGSWAEIGRRPMSLTNGCVAGATAYQIESPTRIQVRDTCHDKTPGGKEKAIGGPGVILDPGTNAKLHVTYRFLDFLPVHRDYWVLDHDDDYSWFISADPAFENLWIYTRNPRIDPMLRQQLVERARDLGYDVLNLEFPPQP